MVTFNELKVSNDGKKLIIDVEIPSLSWFVDSKLKEIYIHTDSTFMSPNQPDKGAVYSTSLTSQNIRSIRLELSPTDMQDTDINKTLFFVFVGTTGVMSGTPEEFSNPFTLGVTANLYPFYQRSLVYMKELTQDCKSHKGFVDFILRMKALENYIYTGHYSQAITFWNKYFKNAKEVIPYNINCNCYG